MKNEGPKDPRPCRHKASRYSKIWKRPLSNVVQRRRCDATIATSRCPWLPVEARGAVGCWPAPLLSGRWTRLGAEILPPSPPKSCRRKFHSGRGVSSFNTTTPLPLPLLQVHTSKQTSWHAQVVMRSFFRSRMSISSEVSFTI